MEVYETTILRPLHKLIKVFASCFVWSALGRRRLPSFFPASGFWTVQDGQAAISRCWLLRAMQRLRMPTRTQRAGRAAAAALTAPSSQRRRTDASDDWDDEWNLHVHRWRGLPLRTDWLSESAGSQLSPAACEKSCRALEYKAPSSSIGASFLQLSCNAPLRSFVGLLWVLCGPLRSFAVFSHTVFHPRCTEKKIYSALLVLVYKAAATLNCFKSTLI